MKYSFCSIWGIGPGRPYDNAYKLIAIVKYDNYLELLFDCEKCLIYNPIGIMHSSESLKIDMATKIIWKQPYYGSDESKKSRIIIKYIYEKENTITIMESEGNTRKIVIRQDVKAFDLYGNVPQLLIFKNEK